MKETEPFKTLTETMECISNPEGTYSLQRAKMKCQTVYMLDIKPLHFVIFPKGKSSEEGREKSNLHYLMH